MSCDEFVKELATWLTRVWDVETPGVDAVPANLTSHAEVCPECRERLRSASSLIGAQGEFGRIAKPSPFLAGRINESLTGLKPTHRGHRVLFSSLAAALAVVLIAVGLMIGPFRGGSGADVELLVKFTLEAPAAKRVHVVGDWNDWNATANPLRDDNSDGVWETDIKLELGREYRYQFFIDDNEWVADPKAPLKIDDGFGGQNSILRI